MTFEKLKLTQLTIDDPEVKSLILEVARENGFTSDGSAL